MVAPPRSRPNGYPQKQKIGLYQPYLTALLDQKLDLWLKSYSNLWDNCFLVAPPRSHPNGYPQKQQIRPSSTLSNDTLRSKIGPVAEKLLKFMIIVFFGDTLGGATNGYPKKQKKCLHQP